MTRLHTHGPFRPIVTLLLVCVLAVRVFVPSGYMWSTGPDGQPQIVVCSGGTLAAPLSPIAATAIAAQERADRHGPDKPAPDHPCAFAAASAAVDLAGAIHPAATRPVAIEIPAPRPIAMRLGLAAPPPPKTGPPPFA